MQAAESSEVSAEGGKEGGANSQDEGEEVKSKPVPPQDQQQCLICMVRVYSLNIEAFFVLLKSCPSRLLKGQL